MHFSCACHAGRPRAPRTQRRRPQCARRTFLPRWTLCTRCTSVLTPRRASFRLVAAWARMCGGARSCGMAEVRLTQCACRTSDPAAEAPWCAVLALVCSNPCLWRSLVYLLLSWSRSMPGAAGAMERAAASIRHQQERDCQKPARIAGRAGLLYRRGRRRRPVRKQRKKKKEREREKERKKRKKRKRKKHTTRGTKRRKEIKRGKKTGCFVL